MFLLSHLSIVHAMDRERDAVVGFHRRSARIIDVWPPFRKANGGNPRIKALSLMKVEGDEWPRENDSDLSYRQLAVNLVLKSPVRSLSQICR